jgi:tRNA 5-methylaminomethyl-2-thiouridine biosynthesis bifunctional protein
LTGVAGGTHIGPMPIVIHPATLVFDPSGTPFSEEFGDVYHSAESGPDQARYVFLHGNDLPHRWAGTRIFTIVETGFGLGLNFMATCAAWRSDPARSERLHFVSVERHPFVREDLAALHARYPEFKHQSAEICAAWPPAIAGVHRLHWCDGRITLTLVFADVIEALRDLRLGADAFYLDGFAPDRNPEMWSPAVMKALACLARPGATLATYTTARAVRDALAAAGFAVEKAIGYGRKREMLRGRFAPRWSIRHPPPPRAEWPERNALVVGAGLAGAAIAERLASRGWRVDILDRNGAAAGGASGLSAGVIQPHLSRDDCILSRFTRAGFLYAHSRRRPIDVDQPPMTRPSCGVLQIADDARHEARMADALAALAYPAEYAQLLSRDAASSRAGRPVRAGGWWIPMGDWARPKAVVRAQLAAATHAQTPAPQARFHREVAALRAWGERWHAIDASGAEIASAPVVVLANACDAARLVDLAPAPLQRVAGQLTLFPASPAAPRTVVCGRGYVLPGLDGNVVTGASYDLDGAMQADDARHAANLRRAERLLPGITADVDMRSLRGEVGMRCVARDRLPMVGPMVDMDRARDIADTLSGAHASDMPRLPGLFCAIAFASRGLAWTALAAECIASQLEGEPLPLEATLVDAIDPGRFAVKRARRGTL